MLRGEVDFFHVDNETFAKAHKLEFNRKQPPTTNYQLPYLIPQQEYLQMTWSAFLVAMRNGSRDRLASTSRTASLTSVKGNASRATSTQASKVARASKVTPEQREHDHIFWRSLNVRR